MSGAEAGEVLVEEPPSLAALYARALLRRAGGRGELTQRTLVLPAAVVDREQVAAYARACGYRLTGAAPLTHPHLLAFPLQVQLMVTEPFPFRLLGLVHLRQSVLAHRPLAVEERPRVRVHAEGLRAHAKGATVDLVARLDVDGEPVWEGRSTYLARSARAPGVDDAAPVAPSPAAAPVLGDADAPRTPTAVWRVPAGTGRRYAAVSGDVNPLHLHPLTARALGFPRAVAHGMWTAARAVAALEPRLPDAVRVEVDFRRPLLLPSTVAFAARAEAGGGWDVAVRSRSGDQVHLLGTVRPAR